MNRRMITKLARTIKLRGEVINWGELEEKYMPRRKCGLCKNLKCKNPNTGKRRQAQSGLGGYCRTCARTFVSESCVNAHVEKANADRRHSKQNCYYCARLEYSAKQRLCDCGSSVVMCDSCFAVHDKATCHSCYRPSEDLYYRCKEKRPVPGSGHRI